MNEHYLHIVAFDIPVPVNYGGAIDIYYKLLHLRDAGVKVILHCFRYGGRTEAAELSAICYQVHYYPRKSGPRHFLSPTPYIVRTRRSVQLEKNLLSDSYPILFEGIHTTYLLRDARFARRKMYVRMHNVEYEYYRGLARSEKRPLKKMFFHSEAQKLKTYEYVLKYATGIITISKSDENYYCQKGLNATCISAFHPDSGVNILPGKGDYILYHGSLDVSENHQVAMFLVNEVFSQPGINFYIAGNKPAPELVSACEGKSHIRLLTSLKTEDFKNLVSRAQVNILPTFQPTGIKLKLLLALHNGRHVLVNPYMVQSTGLEPLCVIANGADNLRRESERLMTEELSARQIEERRTILAEHGFSNIQNVNSLIKYIWP